MGTSGAGPEGVGTRATIMVDPSLLLSPRTALAAEAAIRGAAGRIVVPRAFLGLPRSGELFEGAGRFRFAAQRLEGGLRAGALERLADFAAPELAWQEGEVAVRLRGRGKFSLASQVLLEEWAFLNQRSWIASRVRRPFAQFVKAGAVAVEAGKRVFEREARRVLHMQPDRGQLSALMQLKAISKWLAVGGVSAAPLAHEMGLQIAVGAVAGLFLLYDP